MVPRDEALERFRSRGEMYKVEIIESIPEGEEVSYFQHGDFIDLCRGPHVERTGDIKAFKVLSFAGAYWRGDERNRTAPAGLRHGVPVAGRARRAPGPDRGGQAPRSPHARQGSSTCSRSTIWSARALRSGTRRAPSSAIRSRRSSGARTSGAGYDLVYTPHVAREQLLETSGHLAHYKDNLFGGMELDGQRYLVKPMNCPFHIAIYRSQMRSYRDLPLRYSELGTVYRYERSGVLHGLLRVRGLTMDDGHLFVREDQIADEIDGCLDFALRDAAAVRVRKVRALPRHPPRELHGRAGGLGSRRGGAARPCSRRPGGRSRSTPAAGLSTARRSISKSRMPSVASGSARRSSSTSSCPSGSRSSTWPRTARASGPIMIHRALLGSMERFIAVLIEHFAGAFPLWLAPVQARVLSVSEQAEAYANEVADRLRAEGLRVEADISPEKLGAKVRKAQLEKIPYMVVVGEKDMAARVVSPRTREGKQEPATALDEFAKRLAEQAQSRLSGPQGASRLSVNPLHPRRHYNEALPGDPAGAVSPTFGTLEDKEKNHPKAIQSSSPERNGQLPRRSPNPRARGARHRRRRRPGRGHPDARGASAGRRGRARAGRGQSAGRSTGLQDHGLRQVQVRDLQEREGLAQAPVDHRAQGDQAPPEDRRRTTSTSR